MKDIDLNLAAARAAGIEVRRGTGWQKDMLFRDTPSGGEIVTGVEWNPLKDDGDAFRLAVKLSITLDFGGRSETVQAGVFAYLPKKHRWWASGGPLWVWQEYVPEEMWANGREDDVRFANWYMKETPGIVRGLEAATRRAITRAAAAIDEGRQTK